MSYRPVFSKGQTIILIDFIDWALEDGTWTSNPKELKALRSIKKNLTISMKK